ncbi:hypothetical protein BJF85_04265 [Saccharomonospora sp. CUA-673]|uniref:TetR/AcrR family transcriptional regulator n=1 Tax=Saccharomonospora sp. CUA-673 TaxID=1904969 RepID=UPI00095E1697|nr:TetR/AcrR family transcriptional regulator [Saccharomonospora sp. CUA-673]OLT41651.1 hypothetical protein BJF85_04265 [Saccharomonospora sp. CUA-673]
MPRHKATRTEKIVAVAAEVFEANGYRNTTIDDICQAAGISRPTIYNYIESKPWLLKQMVAMATDELTVELRKVLDTPSSPAEKLRALVRLHIESATRNRIYYATVLSELSELPDDARRSYREWSRKVTYDFARLIDEHLDSQGLERRMETGVLANLILTTFTSLYRWYDPSGPTTPNELAKDMLVLLSGALPGLDQPE